MLRSMHVATIAEIPKAILVFRFFFSFHFLFALSKKKKTKLVQIIETSFFFVNLTLLLSLLFQ